MIKRWTMMVVVGCLAAFMAGPVRSEPAGVVFGASPSTLAKMNVYLTAGDYRRALETSHRHIDEAPSAATYIHLTYVYHAIDAYLEHLSKEERWIAVEHLYLNLASRNIEDLVDPPGGLPRIAKEMIQQSVRQQSDLTAAMANRLDKAESDRLWIEQTAWRTANPQTWWHGLPTTWIRDEQ